MPSFLHLVYMFLECIFKLVISYDQGEQFIHIAALEQKSHISPHCGAVSAS